MALSNVKTVVESVLAPYLVAIEKYHAQTAASMLDDEIRDLLREYDLLEQTVMDALAALRQEMARQKYDTYQTIDALETKHDRDIEALHQRMDDIVFRMQQLRAQLIEYIDSRLPPTAAVSLDGDNYTVRGNVGTPKPVPDTIPDPVPREPPEQVIEDESDGDSPYAEETPEQH